jgi:hypothetical protein
MADKLKLVPDMPQRFSVDAPLARPAQLCAPVIILAFLTPLGTTPYPVNLGLARATKLSFWATWVE